MLKSLGKGAAAVTKAALETEGGAAVYASFQDKKESLMSSVQEGKKAIKKRVLAASVATMNGAVYAALPEAPADTVVPSSEQSDAAAALLGEKWATAVQ